ncbi:MAG TPA: hypothetical protein VM406_06550 [Noviherbaspirillum sp.]|nr:hypothetical protein [Noviherbaspirillum sp.]
MDEEIVLARDRDGYRVLAGRHRLDVVLRDSDEAFADVAGERGRAKVFRTPAGLLVCKDSRYLPLIDASAAAAP